MPSTPFDDLLKNAIFVRDNILNETDRIIEANKEVILDLNREDQLFKLGVDSEGLFLGYYAPFTVFEKKQKGLPYNRVTLFDKGDFYRGFDFIKRPGTLTIFSRDSKSSKLQDDYSSKIFGLTKENQDRLNYEIILNGLRDFANKYL